MNHYAAREIKTDGRSTGKWHYTCQDSKDYVYAVGYCRPWQSCPDCCTANDPSSWIPAGPESCKTCLGKRVTKNPNPCPGHDTPAGACEHYRQYLLDNATFQPETPEVRAKTDQLHKCKAPGCGAFTVGFAQVSCGQWHYLCDAHCNRASLDQLVTVGESFTF